MTTKGRKYFSGNTLDNALLQAARHHGLRPEEVAYRQIEKRHGFLKARKGVLIEVDPDSPRRDLQSEAPIVSEPTASESAAEEIDAPGAGSEEKTGTPAVHEEVQASVSEPTASESVAEEIDAPGAGSEEKTGTSVVHEEVQASVSEPEVEAEPEDIEQPEEIERFESPSVEAGLTVEEVDELIEAVQRGLQEVLTFAKLDLEYEVSEGEDQLEIELHGPDRARLLEDRGNLILSIQHLLPRLVRGYTGRSIPCHVDSENYHELRRVELKDLAEEAAREVRDRQRSRTLPPMNPAERRIIHVSLADEKEVTTESQGRGFFKRVTISPAMRRPRGFDRYSR